MVGTWALVSYVSSSPFCWETRWKSERSRGFRGENAPDTRRGRGSVLRLHALAFPLSPNVQLCTGIMRIGAVHAVWRVAWGLDG